MARLVLGIWPAQIPAARLVLVECRRTLVVEILPVAAARMALLGSVAVAPVVDFPLATLVLVQAALMLRVGASLAPVVLVLPTVEVLPIRGLLVAPDSRAVERVSKALRTSTLLKEQRRPSWMLWRIRTRMLS